MAKPMTSDTPTNATGEDIAYIEGKSSSDLHIPLPPLIQIVTKGFWPRPVEYKTIEELEKEDRGEG